MQMTIQEIKNAINYDELNSVEIIKTTFESIKNANDGILEILGVDDLENIYFMLVLLAEKCELLSRRSKLSSQSSEGFKAFELRYKIFETAGFYTRARNNIIRRVLAAQ